MVLLIPAALCIRLILSTTCHVQSVSMFFLLLSSPWLLQANPMNLKRESYGGSHPTSARHPSHNACLTRARQTRGFIALSMSKAINDCGRVQTPQHATSATADIIMRDCCAPSVQTTRTLLINTVPARVVLTKFRGFTSWRLFCICEWSSVQYCI